jgi:hypothetical protein
MKLRHSILILAAFALPVACATRDDAEIVDQSAALGDADAPLARFAPHLKVLRDMIEKPATPQDAANALLGGGRPAAFSLQGLSRVYKAQDPQFKQFELDFKTLEDGIGGYDKWNGIYSAAQGQPGVKPEKLAELKQKRDDALTRFVKKLTDGRWRGQAAGKSRLDEIDGALRKMKWLPRNQDRAIVLSALVKELKELNETAYDMTHLEEGNGLHELRRDIRWVLLEQRDLKGMIVYKDGDACPIAAYKGLMQEGRFGLTPSELEPAPCKISRCLVSAAGKTVEDIGAIKDKVEVGNNVGDDTDLVPEGERAKVAAIYDGIKTNKLLSVYIQELEACKVP